MKYKLLMFLIIIGVPLSAQNWTRQETRNRWGDLEGHQYIQVVNCTGRGSNGEGTWYFALGNNSKEPNIMLLVIRSIGSFDLVPTLAIFDEQVTISIREGNNVQNFQGTISARSSNFDTLSIICMDTQFLNALYRNVNYTILVEGRNSSWYVRANIKGNLPKE